MTKKILKAIDKITTILMIAFLLYVAISWLNVCTTNLNPDKAMASWNAFHFIKLIAER